MYHILLNFISSIYKIMSIIRAILLSIILIAPVKANTIYNLIKIPNLEIYEINTKNKFSSLALLKGVPCV